MIAHIVGGTCETYTRCASILFDIRRWFHPAASCVRMPHVVKNRSELGLKCHFNLIKPICFLYNKENAVQHRQCTSCSTYSVTMATNSISSGISIDVKSRLFFPVSSTQGFFFVPMKQKVERKSYFILRIKRKHKQHKATFKRVGCSLVATPLAHFSGANSVALRREMSTRRLRSISKMEFRQGFREGESSSVNDGLTFS